MEVQIKEDTVLFSVDYRSPPSGVGTIEKPNGDLILVQEEGCNPPVRDGIFKEIINIPIDMSEDYEEGRDALEIVLKEHSVSVVHDTETLANLGLPGNYMTLEEFIKALR
tara:strand:- start:679 stop:1008 length:330 start_codon:yes stop_codon:yes gene_type:complete